jgi:acyl carrier protein
MRDAEVFDTIRGVFAFREAAITERTPLRRLLRDSLDAVELIAVLSDTYRLLIEPADLDAIETVGDVVAYVRAHAGEAPEGGPLAF